MDTKELGIIIKQQRKKQGLTQKYLAALSNTGVRFISELENGKKTLQIEKVLDVCRVLSIRLELITDEKNA